MRKKLPVLAVLMLPFLYFAQNERNTQNSKDAVLPRNSALITSSSLSAAISKMPSGHWLPSSDRGDGDLLTNVTVARINDVSTSNRAVTHPRTPGAFGEKDYTVRIAPVGCTTSPNGQFPTTTVTPTCNGGTYNITTAGWTGEYSALNVTSGVNYTFRVSNPAYYITITDNAATPTILAGGTGSVSWTSNITGVIRFYSHTSINCDSGTSATVHARSVQCGSAPPEPDYGCDQTYTGTPDLASNIIKNTTLNYVVANDFFVPMESAAYRLQTVTADIVPVAPAGGADIASFNIKIMSNSAEDTPGTVIHTLTNVVPVSVTQLPNTFATYPTFAVKLNLGGYSLPVNAAADTRYWISLQATSASNSSIYWIGYPYTEGWNTKSNYISTNGGVTFAPITSSTDPDQHYESNMTIDADCTVAGVNESGTKNVSFYPNPVKDYLNITSKIKVETVHIYNANGQKMPVSAKITNSLVDMSILKPGMYIISTILENGKNESFKVLKK